MTGNPTSTFDMSYVDVLCSMRHCFKLIANTDRCVRDFFQYLLHFCAIDVLRYSPADVISAEVNQLEGDDLHGTEKRPRHWPAVLKPWHDCSCGGRCRHQCCIHQCLEL